VPPGADHKSAALSTSQICLQKFWMKIHVSCLFKDIRINKAPSKSQSNTHKLKCVLVLIVDYDSCFFCLSPPFSSLNFSIFCFLCIGICEPHMFRQTFLPVGFQISGKLTAWQFNSLPGDQTEKRDVMAAYLLYKCKHIYMLKFRVVFN